ncbi:MAG: hypothetical protein SGJ04_02280 [Bacteroidota bacterium]|nr:hypothetical protein [Bacteroidota bacterium]
MLLAGDTILGTTWIEGVGNSYGPNYTNLFNNYNTNKYPSMTEFFGILS